MNENAMRFELVKGEHRWIYVVHEAGLMEVECRLGSLVTRKRVVMDIKKGRAHYAARKAEGFATPARFVNQGVRT